MQGMSAGSKFSQFLFEVFMVALHVMAHSFIELDKAVVHVTSLVSFL